MSRHRVNCIGYLRSFALCRCQTVKQIELSRGIARNVCACVRSGFRRA